MKNSKYPRKRRRNIRIFLVLLVLVLMISAIGMLISLIFNAFTNDEDANIKYVGDIPVYEDFLPETAMARTGEERKILYVVIHETDNVNEGADAKAHNNFIHTNGVDNELSWHYTVDDHEIWHHLPDNETAFHAGDHMEDKGGNKNGIGVEMCVNADGDYEKTLQNAQLLAAQLLYEYDLDIDALKKHQDFSGKICPSKLINAGRWDEFVQKVEKNLEALRLAES
ncbi:MAG TPA: N-acetylmuramoyl-L-alanine amidase [Candidatus Butyricicoccus avistercoris]|uniref:N-acetylmuramoyl-L-alanine amidase n=1 Tax=Candidatus Butyricicoccus avistercoris TaxID=2838518 RepID=A0A9D1TIT0_9FIRM|nr:N-acetylmuramoyl-L-alanine amidase [Candidatus Butyricicoccus avistercoris]